MPASFGAHTLNINPERKFSYQHLHWISRTHLIYKLNLYKFSFIVLCQAFIFHLSIHPSDGIHFEDMLLMNCIKWLSRTSSFISSTTYKLQNFRFSTYTHSRTFRTVVHFSCSILALNIALCIHEIRMDSVHEVFRRISSYLCILYRCKFVLRLQPFESRLAFFASTLLNACRGVKTLQFRINERFCYWRHSNYCISNFFANAQHQSSNRKEMSTVSWAKNCNTCARMCMFLKLSMK